MKWTKNCPDCGKEQSYSGKRTLKEAIKTKSKCSSCSKKGKKFSEATRKKLSEANKGYKHFEEAKKKMKGKKFSEEHRKNLSKTLKGRKLSEEHRKKMSLVHHKRLGTDPNRDKGVRETLEYHKWRRDVLERDDYTCQSCYKRGGKLQTHHIFAVCHHPEEATKLMNGITLCKPCHKMVHSVMGHQHKNQS